MIAADIADDGQVFQTYVFVYQLDRSLRDQLLNLHSLLSVLLAARLRAEHVLGELKSEAEEVGVDPLHFFKDILDVCEQWRFKVLALHEFLTDAPIAEQYQGKRGHLVNVFHVLFRPVNTPDEEVKRACTASVDV